MSPFSYIAIEGVIGVGKTTLVRLLQPVLKAQPLLELFEENPFLADFYGDRARYAFQTQIVFLLSRYRQQHRVIPEMLREGNVLSDYMFAKDRIFAHANLRGDELDTYDRLHAILGERVAVPDLIVYLYADLPLLLQRIAIRDRSFERNIEPAYLEMLRHAYDTYFESYDEAPVLAINTNELDLIHDPEALQHVTQRIGSALGSGTHQPALLPLSETEVEMTRESRSLPRWQSSAVPTEPMVAPVEALLGLQQQLGLMAGELAQQARPPALEGPLGKALYHLLELARSAEVDLEQALGRCDATDMPAPKRGLTP